MLRASERALPAPVHLWRLERPRWRAPPRMHGLNLYSTHTPMPFVLRFRDPSLTSIEKEIQNRAIVFLGVLGSPSDSDGSLRAATASSVIRERSNTTCSTRLRILASV